MTTIKVELDYFKTAYRDRQGNILPKSLHPFWFSNGGEIHLTYDNSPSAEIDVDFEDNSDEMLTLLFCISVGVKSGTIKCSHFDEITKYLAKKDADVKIEPRREPSLEKADELKANSLLEAAKELLSLGGKKVIEKIGAASSNEDGTSPDGVFDIKVLELALSTEKETSARNNVIKAIEARLEYLKSLGGFAVVDKTEGVTLSQEDINK